MRLEEGDVIRHVEYLAPTLEVPPVPRTLQNPAGSPRIAAAVEHSGVLTVDHIGKVTDITPIADKKDFSPQQKSDLAKKQAELYMLSPNSKHGDIIIRGNNAADAALVCAWLLALNGSKKVNIISYVPGFEVPKAGFFDRQKTVDDNFIKTTLGSQSPAYIKCQRELVGRFVDATNAHRKGVDSEKSFDDKDRLEFKVGEPCDLEDGTKAAFKSR